MSLLEFTNITPTELSSNGVVALADRPNISSTYGTGGLSPTQLKLWFDKLATLLSARINTVQTALKTSGASYIAVSGLGETITSIADLAASFLDGSFADILLAYQSAADEGDTDNLVSLQTIINTKAEAIAEIAEDLAEYIALIDSNVGAAEIGIADAYNGAGKKLSDLVGDIANGVLATKLTFDAYGFATADKATATSTNLKAFVDKVADALQGDISSGVLERIVAIENNIGTTALGTTATTITGAIAEHESDIGGIKTDIGTTDISGIAATVKAAVASLNSDIDSLQQGIVHREIRTLLTSTTAGTLTTELAAAMTDYIVTNLGRQPNLTDAIAVRDTQDVDLSLVYTYYYWTATAADDTEGWYLAAHYKTPAFTETPAYTYSFTAEDWSDTADARGLYTYAIPHTTHGMGETSSLTVRMLKLSGTDYVQINQFEIATDGTVTLFTDDTTLIGIIVIATGTSYYIPALSIYDSVSVDNVIGLGALGLKDTVDEDDITAESDLAAAVTNSHTHANKAALDSYVSTPVYEIAVATTTEGYSKSYELTKDGVATGVKIDIPADLVVSSGEVKTVETIDTPYTGAEVGDKYIDITLNNTPASHIYIPVNDLVDAYTAGNGIAIDGSNVVSVTIDSGNANGLAVTSSGVKLTVATTSAAGAMSASDKTKLDGIATGAQVNVLEGVKVGTETAGITSKIADIKEAILAVFYPVGSIKMTTTSTNPSTYMGGTWVAWGAGRVPVGVDTAQTEFNTVEKSGGEKTHTLTVDELPEHNHDIPIMGTKKPRITITNITTNIDEEYSTIDTDNTGGGEAHNNLQPYITCYMWKRTE